MTTDAAGMEILRAQVERALAEFVQRKLPAGGEPEFAPLRTAADALLSGGKRLRPAFCYWGVAGRRGHRRARRLHRRRLP
ncbi:hypothetical protein GCM10020001_081540 [Nonomuraea salmonea]